jgi:hypothetical protein
MSFPCSRTLSCNCPLCKDSSLAASQAHVRASFDDGDFEIEKEVDSPEVTLHSIVANTPKIGSVYISVVNRLLSTSSHVVSVKKRATGKYSIILGEPLGVGIPFKALSASTSSSPFKPLVNCYRGFKSLCWKAKQVETLRSYCEEHKKVYEDIAPTSFLYFPSQPIRSEVDAFLKMHREIEKEKGRCIWILKPSNGSKVRCCLTTVG